MSLFATIPVPDARRNAGSIRQEAHDECRALVTNIRRQAVSKSGQAPTVAQIAELLGISESTLEKYCRAPRTDRSMNQRGTPYLVLYALGALSANPEATGLAIWGR